MFKKITNTNTHNERLYTPQTPSEQMYLRRDPYVCLSVSFVVLLKVPSLKVLSHVLVSTPQHWNG